MATQRCVRSHKDFIADLDELELAKKSCKNSLSELSTKFVIHFITVLLDPEKFPGWVVGGIYQL